MEFKKFYSVGIHIMQQQAVGAINRDETGAPKDTRYGGVLRLRNSSQSQVWAARQYLKKHFGDDSVRLSNLNDLIAGALEERAGAEKNEAKTYAKAFMVHTGLMSSKEDKKETSMLFSERQLDAIFKKVVSLYKEEKNPNASEGEENAFTKEDEKEIYECITGSPAMSQLFFGRMFASNPDYNYNACCKRAHAISVTKYDKVFDIFTAKDDNGFSTKKGAAFLDTRVLGAGLMYRYSDLDLSDTSSIVMEKTIDEADAAAKYIEAFAMSTPTGGENTYASFILPDRIIVDIREDRPVNLVGAFDEPIDGEGVVEKANKTLDKYREKVFRMYGGPVATFDTADGLTMSDICKKVEEFLRNR